MKAIDIIVLCIGLAGPSIAASGSLEAKAGSAVWLVGDSTMHLFTSRTTDVRASGALEPQTVLPPAGTLKSFDILIPVTSLKSKESALDKNMYKDLKADHCPNITFHLSHYEVVKDSASAEILHAKADGTLVISCQERPVTLDVKLTPGPDSLRAEGQYTLLMTDYGIKPPAMMMGTIKVKNPVVIHFDLQLGSANPS